MQIPKKLKELVDGTHNRIKFDSIGSLLKVIGINKKHLESLKYHKMIKIKHPYLYVNPNVYDGGSLIPKSIYDMFIFRYFNI